MVDLPPFTDDGLLPAGDYGLTLEALRTSPLVLGPGEQPRQMEPALLLLTRYEDQPMGMISNLR